jgi:hypothetical protein
MDGKSAAAAAQKPAGAAEEQIRRDTHEKIDVRFCYDCDVNYFIEMFIFQFSDFDDESLFQASLSKINLKNIGCKTNQVIFEISQLLNTGLDRQQLTVATALIENGVDPAVRVFNKSIQSFFQIIPSKELLFVFSRIQSQF